MKTPRGGGGGGAGGGRRKEAAVVPTYRLVGPGGALSDPVDVETLSEWILQLRIGPATRLRDEATGQVVKAQAVPALADTFATQEQRTHLPPAPARGAPGRAGALLLAGVLGLTVVLGGGWLYQRQQNAAGNDPPAAASPSPSAAARPARPAAPSADASAGPALPPAASSGAANAPGAAADPAVVETSPPAAVPPVAGGNAAAGAAATATVPDAEAAEARTGGGAGPASPSPSSDTPGGAAAAPPARVRTVVTNAALRSRPAKRAPHLKILARGTALTVHGERDGYFDVTMPMGTRGWVVKWAVRPDESAEPGTP